MLPGKTKICLMALKNFNMIVPTFQIEGKHICTPRKVRHSCCSRNLNQERASSFHYFPQHNPTELLESVVDLLFFRVSFGKLTEGNKYSISVMLKIKLGVPIHFQNSKLLRRFPLTLTHDGLVLNSISNNSLSQCT